MSDDPELAHYRGKSKRWLKDFLKHAGPKPAHRAMILGVLGEIEAAENQERSAMERRQTSIAERAASAAEAAAAEARSARIIAIAALTIATMLSAPMIAVVQALIRFLH